MKGGRVLVSVTKVLVSVTKMIVTYHYSKGPIHTKAKEM